VLKLLFGQGNFLAVEGFDSVIFWIDWYNVGRRTWYCTC